jgi:hypothetical protein
MKLSQFRSKTRKITVEFEGEKFAVEYKPVAITPSFNERFLSDDVKVSTYLVAYIVEVVDSWELTDDDGIPLALTMEVVANIPTILLDAIFGAINEDIRPKETKKGSFAAG